MFKRVLLFVVILNFIFSFKSNLITYAEEKVEKTKGTYLAVVDVPMLFAIHPKMQYYDQKVGLFIRMPKSNVSSQEFAKIMKSRNNDFIREFEANSAEIKRLKFELDTLKSEINRLEEIKQSELNALNQKYVVNNEIKDKSAYQSELEAIDKKFKNDIEPKQKKYNDLLDSLLKIQKNIVKIYYLTPEETKKQLEEINSEIKEAILEEAKKHGVKTILNLNLMLLQQIKKASVNLIEKSSNNNEAYIQKLEEIVKYGPDYTKILAFLRTFESGMSKEVVESRPKHFDESEYIKMLKQMQKEQELEVAKKSFLTKEYIMQLEPIKNLTSEPIVFGGIDLTYNVAMTLLTKNGVSNSYAEKICNYLFK